MERVDLPGSRVCVCGGGACVGGCMCSFIGRHGVCACGWEGGDASVIAWRTCYI